MDCKKQTEGGKSQKELGSPEVPSLRSNSERQIPTYSMADFAQLLQVTKHTIWQMRRRGELPPAIRVGRYLRWRPEVVEQYLRDAEKPANEFDPVLCARAEKAAVGRNPAVEKTSNHPLIRRGRPTKKESVERAIKDEGAKL